MKRDVNRTLLLAAVMMMIFGAEALAQRGRGMDRRGGAQQVCVNIPNLTEDQRAQLQSLRSAHLSEMQSYRNQIDTNRNRYRELIQAGAVERGAIDANIEERATIRSQMMKKQVDHRLAIRELLTDEQRSWFDSAPRGGVGSDRPATRGGGGGRRR